MPFDSGSQSFIICHMPQAMPEDALERFEALAGAPFDAIPSDQGVGWVSGRHLLETRIDEESGMLGGYMHLNMRVTSRKVPNTLFKARCRIEELAYIQANKCINVPAKQKSAIRDNVTDMLLPDMPPSLAGIPFVIDPNHSVMYLGATSIGKIDLFLDFFGETIGFEPVPLYPQQLAEVLFSVDHHDIEPLRFTSRSVEADEDAMFGRDFLTWLWYFQTEEGGEFTLDAFPGTFGIRIDGPLTFAQDAQGGMESVIRKGVPLASAESKAALLGGKKLRKASVQLVREKEEWNFGLDADSFVISGMKLPEGERLDPMSHFQERVLNLNVFREAFLKLYGLFLEQVTDERQADDLCDKLTVWTENLRTTLPDR